MGSVIHIFRSADGVTWRQYGTTDFSVAGEASPLPESMYVGMVYGPEIGNITPETERKLWTVR